MKKEYSNLGVMFRMIHLVKPLLIWMIFAILMGVAGFLCAIFIPVGITLLVAQHLQGFTWIATSSIILFIFVIALLRGILHYIEQDCNHYIAFKLLALLRDRIFRQLRRLAPAKLEGKEKGNLVSVITSDIELLEVFYAHTISPVFIGILTSLILLFCFYQMHPFFALIALLGYVMVGGCIPYIVSKVGKKDGDACRKELGALSAFVLESIRGLQDILQYGNENIRQQALKNRSEKVNLLQKKLRFYEGCSSAASGCCVQLFSFLMLVCGIYLYQQGSIPFAFVLLAFVLMFSSFGPVIALANVSNNLLLTLASGRRVLTLLEESPQVEEKIHGKYVEPNDIQLHHVTFGYEDEIILQDLSTVFEKGKITGILGKSGSGKSTLLKLMMRFFDVKEGCICIQDTPIDQITTSHLRNLQSYVTQDTILFHDTILENIRIAKQDASKEEVIQACKQASIHDFIMSLPHGYDTTVEELGDSLSGGEKQRLSLARAFLHDGEYIFLDEPTSNLDVLNESVILKSLKALEDKTIVLVSHRASTMHICDTTLKMHEGRCS